MAEQPIDKDGLIKAGAINSIIEEFDKWKTKLLEIDVLIDKLGKSTPIIQPPKNTEDLNKLLTKIEQLEAALKEKSETEKKLSAIEKERVNINKQVIGTLQESNTEWRNQTSNMQENAKALQENKRELKSVQAEIKRLNGEIEAYGKFKARSQENADAVKQMNDRVTQLTAEEAKLKVNISQTNIMLKTQAKEMLAVDGSMEKANHTLGQMRKLWRQMTAEEKNSPFGKQLLGEIEALDAGLKSADAEIGNFQRGVGNYKGAVLEAFNSTGLFGAEMGKITTLLGTLTSSMPRVVSRLGSLDTTVGKLGKGVGGLSTSFRGLGTAFRALPIIGWISLIAEAVSWIVELTTATKEQTEAERKANDERLRGNKIRAERFMLGKDLNTQYKNRATLTQAELKLVSQALDQEIAVTEQKLLAIKTIDQQIKSEKDLDDILNVKIKHESEEIELMNKRAGLNSENLIANTNLIKLEERKIDLKNEGALTEEQELTRLKRLKSQKEDILALIIKETSSTKSRNKAVEDANRLLREQLKLYNDVLDLEDDLWFRNLGDEDQEVVKRMQQLDAEMAKVEADTMMRAEAREALRKALINDSEKDIQAIRDKFAKERIDKENEAIRLEKERIEQARLDEIQGLEEQALLAKEVRTNELLQSKLSKDEFDKQSLDSEIKYLEEMIQIRKDAGIETIDLENQLLTLRKNANDKANKEFVNSVASSVTLLKDLYSDEIDFAISKQNELIANSQKTIDNIKQAAMAGNIQAKESILAEEKAIEESQKRIEQAQKRKQRMEFISTGINAFNSSVQSGKSGLEALGETAVTMSGLAGMLAGLLPSFDVGADRLTGDGRGIDGKGGFLAINHPDERIMTAEQNAIIGYHHKNSDIANIMSFYNKGLLRPAHEIGTVVTYDNSEVLDRIDKGFSKINNWNISVDELFGTISVMIEKSKGGNIHRSTRNYKA